MEMSSVGCAKGSYVAFRASCILDASVSGVGVGNVIRRLAIVLGAALLAGCAQSSVVSNSEFVRPGRQASLQRNQTASLPRHVAAAKKHTPFARHHAAPIQIASRGIASFYTQDQQTASGEKFNTNDLTAAHPTLPFGTRLRVTNVATGRSVTVRINDRGPYVPGRVVDVSHSAADALGMVRSGIAEVKLDVVQ
jgi:peptidoglycan lytic transglycosylase